MDKKVVEVMDERFGHDTLISLATINANLPCVRIINSYYEDGAFYTITHAKSNKIKQIENNNDVAICGEWFTANGLGYNLGHICDMKNATMASKLQTVFEKWYDNGHTDENDPNTIILRIKLTNAVLFSHGIRYDINF